MAGIIRKFKRDARGGAMIEYGLIAALVVIAMVGALRTFASAGVGRLEQVNAAATAAMGNL